MHFCCFSLVYLNKEKLTVTSTNAKKLVSTSRRNANLNWMLVFYKKKPKWKKIFHYLHKQPHDIILLQETHSTQK